MFKVRNIYTGEVETVYAVCGVSFLFYNGVQWYYGDMNQYEPVEDDE